VAFDVFSSDPEVKLLNGLADGDFQIEFRCKASTRGWVESSKRGRDTAQQAFAVRILEVFQVGGDGGEVVENHVLY
jgi:hypothetical protein